MTAAPLVTVGMPVRNGGQMFPAALDSVLQQDHSNIEVLISDNGSTDGTQDVAEQAAAVDNRVRYIRPKVFLPAFENFLSLIPQARGEFFLWAAHDDLRSSDYISSLLGGFDRPGVVLSFGDLDIMSVYGGPVSRRRYEFENIDLSRAARIRKQALMQCYHLYGVWRTSELAALPRPNCKWWPDLPLMMAAAARGYFRHVPGPSFRYYERPKTDAERAQYESGRAQSSSKISNVLELLSSSYAVMRQTAGPSAALWTSGLVIEKNIRFAGVGVRRRVSEFFQGLSQR